MKTPSKIVAAIWLALAVSQGAAASAKVGYSGRMTNADGAPLSGPVDLKLRFFDAASGGNQLGADVDIGGVSLNDGVFQLALDSVALQKIFAANATVYIEVTDVTDKKTYPRQAFQAVPYALHVPVDGTSITYDNNGLLTVPAPAAVTPPTAGSSQSGYLATSDWVQFNAAPPKTYVDSLNTAQVASVAALSTGLTTTNSNLTTTSNAVTTLNGAALKKDGSVPLTATWNAGSQDITNIGNLTMVGSKVFGLSVATSDPANLVASDIGKIWYNGGIKLWNGTSAQSLGIAGAGLMSINSLNSGTQTLSNAVTGTTPAWNSAGSTHTLNIPMANAGGAVTAGLISNAEWTLFNAKQPALGNASAAGSGILTNTDWSSFNGKQPLLSPAAATVSGYLMSSDWAFFNAKQPAGSYVPTTRNVNTTAPITGGGNLGSDLTLTIGPATLAASGYLSSADWATFNGKDPARSTGNLAETTSNVLTISGGASAVIGAGTTIAVTKAALAANGYLSSADWAAFNAKQGSGSYVGTTRNVNTTAPLTGGGNLGADLTLAMAPATVSASGYLASADWAVFNAKDPARTLGNLTETTSNILTITGGAGSVIGGGATIAVARAGAAANGYLGSGDWLAFNGRISSQWTSAGANIYFNSGNVGIGTTNPAATLDVAGGIKATTLQLTTAPGSGKILTSDASGNGSWTSAVLPAARVTMTADATGVGDTTSTPLSFAAETFNNSGAAMHSNSTNPSRLIAPKTGVYEVSALVAYVANADSGVRGAYIRVNGSTLWALAQVPNVGNSYYTIVPVTALVQMTAGDYAEMLPWKVSGGGLTVASAYSYFAMHFVSP